MALFKSLRGKRENLPSSKTDGYAYFCTDDGTFWIDYTDDSGVVQRKQINAKDAETIMGHTVEIDVPSNAKFTDTTYDAAGASLGLVKTGGDATIIDGVITIAELDSKVNVETGKGLSTNDLTDVLKENYDTAYTHSQQPHNYAGSSTSGGAATSANKLNTDAGSETQPVYFKNGVPIVTNTLDSVAFDGYVTKGAESGSTIGASATVEGVNNMASSKQSHAEGGYTRAGDLTLYSESTGMFDSYGYEHAEGYSTLAKKCAAHAEGAHTQAIASMAHAEGLSTIASGGKSHAEGHSTTASGANAHAEGYSTTASGENTHAEGNSTTASLQAAHAEGYGTTASGYAAHAEGYSTKASSENQHVQGKYNIEDTANTYAHIVGNGTSDTTRSNAHTLDWNGNAWFAGKVTSENANYAEVGQWVDGNTNDEDRIGYFVAIDDTTEGRTMVKATSTADVRGVTVDSPAFSGGYSADKADSNGELSKQYDYVAIMGIVPVIDNGTCTVNGRCMPADDGTAIPSTNNLGYQVIERIDSTHVMIAFEPGADMMNRIKDDVVELQNHISSTNNPHKITAAQIGAAPATHVSDTTIHVTADERTAWNAKADATHSHAAGDITSGTFDAARIPSLAVGKITSGTFTVARGGTGKSSVAVGNFLVGNGTSAMTEKTPAQVLSAIGAAASSHTHSGYAASSHNQAASTITAGTFAATEVKAATGTDYTTARVRNIKASTTDLTAGSSSLSNGDIYLVYE